MDTVKDASERIDKVNFRLEALKYLFNFKTDEHLRETFEGFEVGDIDLKNVYHNENTTITYVTYHKNEAYLPLHTHIGSHEYLIITKGMFVMRFAGGYGRVMQRGECASIPTGVEHTCVAMEEGSELIAICVPPEPAYKIG